MLIRSQNKKKVAVLSAESNLYVSGNSVFIGNSLLGDYESEEKAMKVLDMICTRANDLHYDFMKAVGSHSMHTSEPHYDIVFQMPLSDEV